MIDSQKVISNRFPGIKDKPGSEFIYRMIKFLTHEDEINYFIETHQHLRGFSFIDKALEYFNFSYRVSNSSFSRIPAEGRLIIVANHPIGSLDGLALLKLIYSIRPDVKIVTNDLLAQIEPLSSLFLSVDNFSEDGKALLKHKKNYKHMLKCLSHEEALIIFPAGEVSRISPDGVRDGKWKKGFLKLAEKTAAPILPVYIEAKNSALFYGLSSIYKPLGTMMLSHEMFNKNNYEINFHIGKPILYKSIKKLNLDKSALAKRFRKHIYQLNKKKIKKDKILFETIETIVHPVDRKALKKALYESEQLGETTDGKKIFLYQFQADSPVIHEIGRLRELSFRAVEEGTGSNTDIDKFDTYYQHIVLWDDRDLEIVGSYRLGDCQSIIKRYGTNGLYSSTLFHFNAPMDNYLQQALELGRSFVQPRYWGRRSLDYLWQGIGAYLRTHPNIKYLLGPVSLSNGYPEEARQLLVAFYQQQFGASQMLATARHPYLVLDKYQHLFTGDYEQNFKRLNDYLHALNVKVPTLYKQYTELCENHGLSRGSTFIDFSIDPQFNDCIDGLILLSIDKMKPKKRRRYIYKN